jgi:SHS2 domain-containing protein
MLVVMGLPFEVIDHTADIGIVARGSDLSALFSNAAAGMLSLLIEADTLRRDITREISLEAGDTESLLVEWLNELLYIIDTEKLVLCKFDILIEGNRLTARCAGQELDRKSHRLRREIKAATYHDLEVYERDGEYSARIIFDI